MRVGKRSGEAIHLGSAHCSGGQEPAALPLSETIKGPHLPSDELGALWHHSCAVCKREQVFSFCSRNKDFQVQRDSELVFPHPGAGGKRPQAEVTWVSGSSVAGV